MDIQLPSQRPNLEWKILNALKGHQVDLTIAGYSEPVECAIDEVDHKSISVVLFGSRVERDYDICDIQRIEVR